MAQNKEKVALFDFCETLVSFQTADAYIRYIQSHSKSTNIFVKRLYNILNKSRILGIVRRIFPKASVDKRFLLKQMKGRSYEDMERFARDYYMNKIKPNLIHPVVEQLLKMQAEGFEIVIVSGGYDIYLKYFAEEFNVKYTLSTSIEFKNGICTGRFSGKDCMFDYKIDCIHSVVNGDVEKWYAFSDSITDLPMLGLVGNPVVVSKHQSQIWAEKRNIKQLIWS